MEIIFSFILLFGISTCVGYPSIILHKSHDKNLLHSVKNGTRLSFISVYDGSAITVQKNGDVLAEDWTGKPEQKWLVVDHPRDAGFIELIHEMVPYNALSGFQDSEHNPGLFPRPLSFGNPYGNVDFMEIRIRTRWCLQANGRGWPLDIDDCEFFYAPWQLWKFIETS